MKPRRKSGQRKRRRPKATTSYFLHPDEVAHLPGAAVTPEDKAMLIRISDEMRKVREW